MADKRTLKRHRKRLSLKFGIEEPVRLAFTEDISPQGLFIKTANVCPAGNTIKIDLTLPDNQVVQIEAKVLWAKKVPPQMIHTIKKSGMGVRIVRILSGEELYGRMCEELLAH